MIIDVPLSADFKKVSFPPALLTVNAEGITGCSVAVCLYNHRGLFFIPVFRHFQFLEIGGQIKIRGAVDLFIKRFGAEGLDIARLFPPDDFWKPELLCHRR